MTQQDAVDQLRLKELRAGFAEVLVKCEIGVICATRVTDAGPVDATEEFALFNQKQVEALDSLIALLDAA